MYLIDIKLCAIYMPLVEKSYPGEEGLAARGIKNDLNLNFFIGNQRVTKWYTPKYEKGTLRGFMPGCIQSKLIGMRRHSWDLKHITLRYM